MLHSGWELGSEVPPQVEFEDDAEDVEEVEIDKTPKRKVHGRQPTAFVPKAQSSSGARALFVPAEDTHLKTISNRGLYLPSPSL